MSLDLEERYKWAENNQDKVLEIVNNAYNFGIINMSPEIMKNKLKDLIEK